MDEVLRPGGLDDRLRQVPTSGADVDHPARAAVGLDDLRAGWLETRARLAASWSARDNGRWALTVLLVAAIYFGSALAGNALKLTGNVDAVWPPAGVGIAAIYLGGLWLLPGVL